MAEQQAARRARKSADEDGPADPPALLGMRLGMDIEEACKRLNRYTTNTYRVKKTRQLGREIYTVPYSRTHSLMTAYDDRRVVELDFPPEVLDDLLELTELNGPNFVKAFADMMNLPPMVPGPTVATRGPSWTYTNPASFELLLFGNRGMVLKDLGSRKAEGGR